MNKLKKVSAFLLLFTAVFFTACGEVEPYTGPMPTPLAPVSPATLPTVTTTPVSSINATSATSGGNVTADGGASITARGIVWSINQNPTTANSKTIDGAGTGAFTSAMTGLTAHTTYYVRGYAKNANGTSYGNQVSFTTPALAAPSAFMAGIFNGTAMSNMRPAWYGGSFGGLDEVGVDYDGNNDRFLHLQGNGLNGLQLNIWIPQVQWAVGTYSLLDHDHYVVPSSNAWLVQNLPTVSSTDIISGTITITEFSLITKRIKGTFSFTYNNFMVAGGPNEGPYQVTNGTFDHKLNDPYFN